MKLDLTKAPVLSPAVKDFRGRPALCLSQDLCSPPPSSMSELRPSLSPVSLDTVMPGVVRIAKHCWELICWWQLLGSLIAGSDWGIRWIIGWEVQQTANWGRKDEFHGSAGSSGLIVHPVTGCRDGHLWLPRAPCHPATPQEPPLCSSGLHFPIPPCRQFHCCLKKDLSYRIAEAIGAGLQGGRSGTVR